MDEFWISRTVPASTTDNYDMTACRIQKEQSNIRCEVNIISIKFITPFRPPQRTNPSPPFPPS
jgi:hypothetical protein